MRAQDFLKSPSFDANIFICSGKEFYFQEQVKNAIVKHFPDRKVDVVDAEEDNSDFYSKIESSNLFSEDRIIVVDNNSGKLKEKKFFEQYALSSQNKHIVIGDYSSKNGLEIECLKLKDSPKEVNQQVAEMFKRLGLNFESKDIPIFYFLYRNNLQAIWNEIQKINLYSRATKKTLLNGESIRDILSSSTETNPFRFSNNFMHRKLKGSLNVLPEEKDFLLHVTNILSTAEKVYLAKKVTDSELVTNYKFNNYYYSQSIQPLKELWLDEELKNLIVDMNDFRLKLKSFTYPTKQKFLEVIFKYCR